MSEQIKQQFMALVPVSMQVAPLLQNYYIYLQENYQLYHKRNGGLFNIMKKKNEEQFEINYFDPRSNSVTKKRMTFTLFSNKFNRVLEYLMQLGNKGSGKYQQLNNSPVDKIFNFFFDLYFDIYTIKEQCIGFENCLLTLLKTGFKNEKLLAANKEKINRAVSLLYEKEVKISEQMG